MIEDPHLILNDMLTELKKTGYEFGTLYDVFNDYIKHIELKDSEIPIPHTNIEAKEAASIFSAKYPNRTLNKKYKTSYPVHVNIGLAAHMYKRKHRNAFAFYLKVKSMFVNTVIYSATPKRISRLTGYSVKSVNKYVKVLNQYFLTEPAGDTIVFRNHLKISKDLGIKYVVREQIDTTKNNSPKFIRESVDFLLVKNNLIQQSFNVAASRGTISDKIPLTKRSKKKALRQFGKLEVESQSSDVKVTTRQLGKILNLSRTSISNLLIKAEKEGLIKREFLKKKIKQEDAVFKIVIDNSISGQPYMFKAGNSLWMHEGTSIKLL